MAAERIWQVGDLRLSGFEAAPESPAATVLALHGGGYSARYWDHPLVFDGSLTVVLNWQTASGHNISLHRVARAYHVRALAFFDEVLARPPR